MVTDASVDDLLGVYQTLSKLWSESQTVRLLEKLRSVDLSGYRVLRLEETEISWLPLLPQWSSQVSGYLVHHFGH